jgi:hypothetical protein
LVFIATDSVVGPDGAAEAAALDELEDADPLVADVEFELEVTDAVELEDESSLHPATTSTARTTTDETTIERFTLSPTAAAAEEIAERERWTGEPPVRITSRTTPTRASSAGCATRHLQRCRWRARPRCCRP